MNTEAYLPARVKQPVRVAEHSPSSYAEDINGEAATSDMFSWCGAKY
jgi:hypothetical protein